MGRMVSLNIHIGECELLSMVGTEPEISHVILIFCTTSSSAKYENNMGNLVLRHCLSAIGRIKWRLYIDWWRPVAPCHRIQIDALQLSQVLSLEIYNY